MAGFGENRVSAATLTAPFSRGSEWFGLGRRRHFFHVKIIISSWRLNWQHFSVWKLTLRDSDWLGLSRWWDYCWSLVGLLALQTGLLLLVVFIAAAGTSPTHGIDYFWFRGLRNGRFLLFFISISHQTQFHKPTVDTVCRGLGQLHPALSTFPRLSFNGHVGESRQCRVDDELGKTALLAKSETVDDSGGWTLSADLAN